MAIAARMPMMATTTISSINVKPALLRIRFIFLLPLSVVSVVVSLRFSAPSGSGGRRRVCLIHALR